MKGSERDSVGKITGRDEGWSVGSWTGKDYA